MTNPDSQGRVYLITGGNSGIGLEAVRQIATANPSNKVYMLCRSEERANAAMERIGNPPNVRFVEFDAYNHRVQRSNDQTPLKSIVPDDVVDVVLLNAGGFGEESEPPNEDATRPSKLARLNLMGHVALVKNLLEQKKLRKGSRIVASGSEACIAQKFDWKKADFHGILQGRKPSLYDYGWVKGLVGLYWSAFARHHPEFLVVTASPGAVKTTSFYDQKGVPGVVSLGARLAIFLNGSHTVEEAARRYTDCLSDNDLSNGSFLVHRKGYTQDFGDITTHPRGGAFGDAKLQERAWEAVEEFWDSTNY